MNYTSDSEQMKALIKSALLELLEERKDLFIELFAQAMEDAALARAVKEGESTPYVTRGQIFDLLEPTKRKFSSAKVSAGISRQFHRKKY